MGPGGMSPEAGALTRGVTEGVPLPPLLLPHPGHVISQSLNRPACEMGMTIAVTQASRPTTVRPTATAPGVRHCTRGCPHTDLCHPHLCPVGNCPQDAGSLASLWEAAPGHPQPTHRRHGRQPHGSGARQALGSTQRPLVPGSRCPGPGWTAGTPLGLHFPAVTREARPHLPPRGALGVSPERAPPAFCAGSAAPALGATRIPPLTPQGQASGFEHSWVRSRRALEPIPHLEVAQIGSSSEVLGDETF